MKASLTSIVSSSVQAQSRPVLVLIPGGPGISAATLRSMDILSRSFDMVYVNPSGTGEFAPCADPTFAGIQSAIEAELRNLKRPVILCGHSFGALFGIELAYAGKLNVAGIVSLAAPLSRASYQLACELFVKYMNPKLEAALAQMDQNPTRENFALSLTAYGKLYFAERNIEAGRKLLERDLGCPQSSIRVLPVLSEGTIDFVGHLASLNLPKFMIAGSLDLLFPPDALMSDARATHSKFYEVSEAGHFVTFDQPEAVAGLIEEFFIDSKNPQGKK